MACRCTERREAIRKAWAERSLGTTVEAARFVVRTLTEDAENAGRRLVRSGFERRKG